MKLKKFVKFYGDRQDNKTITLYNKGVKIYHGKIKNISDKILNNYNVMQINNIDIELNVIDKKDIEFRGIYEKRK